MEIAYNKPSKKLWNPKSFVLFSFIFSFLPAGIMYSINYGRAGHKEKKWKSLVYTFIGFIVFIVLIFIIPISSSASKAIGCAINGGIGAYFMNSQTKLYKQYIENGGKRASFLIPTSLCLILSALCLIAIIHFNSIPNNFLNYNKSKLYYTDNVTNIEAKNLGDYLNSQSFFTKDQEEDVKLDKQNNVYIFSIIIKEEYLNNKEMMDNMKGASQDLCENVFGNKKVRIDLCNNKFKVLKSINAD